MDKQLEEIVFNVEVEKSNCDDEILEESIMINKDKIINDVMKMFEVKREFEIDVIVLDQKLLVFLVLDILYFVLNKFME